MMATVENASHRLRRSRGMNSSRTIITQAMSRLPAVTAASSR
jgi:hypothetical protein